MGKFKQGDRVKCSAENAKKLGRGGTEGTVLEVSPNQGKQGFYMVIFDGEDQPKPISGELLTFL